MTETEVLIIGGGLCGLTAARALRSSGHEVLVIEKAERIGGRLNGIEIDGAAFDLGAQFFTVRSAEFRELVEEWIALGIASEWFRGLPTWPGGFKDDGYPRYRGRPSMGALAEHLAVGTEVRTSAAIMHIQREEKWVVKLESGKTFVADWLISTPPVPEIYPTFLRSHFALPQEFEDEIARQVFEPCLALAVKLAGTSRIPEPGALQMEHEVLSWIADNGKKGLPGGTKAVTLHASGAWSKVRFGDKEKEIADAMLAAAEPWLGEEVLAWRLLRWQNAKTVNPSSVGAMGLAEMKLVVAGDSFAGAKVEGAVLSGLRAAEMVTSVEVK